MFYEIISELSGYINLHFYFRKLFRYTLIHLPLLLTLLYINKVEESQKVENLSNDEITKEYVMSRMFK